MQSVAVLALTAMGELDFDVFLFANVGEDSENPATLSYLHQHAMPFAAAHGIELRELHRTRRDGSIETLYDRLMREGSRSIPIPVRMSNGAPGTRSCTVDFKIKVTGRELKRRGASARCPATLGIGISVDEIHRANNRRSEPYEQIVYPLLELGIRRTDCARIIQSVGLPVPPPSSCWFCPHHRPETWAAMRRTQPAQFRQACQLENTINARRTAMNSDPVWLTRFNGPLDQVIPLTPVLPSTDDRADDPAGDRDDDGRCDSGWCFT
ncbi:phosphoadenosine phosphosulfate reductase [Actinomadura kijaniata]|uniref:phosphoadenosine phosphosulfate reductase n=1 Tax=Actinomadura kijaniata TaxID=46161 RepID=UPI001C3F4B58|nr:phosphoadenosine phosphosulfate reductase [Actinomadura kijaniata]